MRNILTIKLETKHHTRKDVTNALGIHAFDLLPPENWAQVVAHLTLQEKLQLRPVSPAFQSPVDEHAQLDRMFITVGQPFGWQSSRRKTSNNREARLNSPPNLYLCLDAHERCLNGWVSIRRAF